MLEYLAMLLVISLILIAIYSPVKNRIPLRPQIIYGTVGVSFALGAVFPIAISTVTPGEVLAIYFGLIALSAIALSYAESRVSLNVSPTPVKVADLEPESIPSEPVEDSFSRMLAEDMAALEACATLDSPLKTGPAPDAPAGNRPQETELPAPMKDKPVMDETAASRDLTSSVGKESVDLPAEEELPLNVEVFNEKLLIESSITLIEEPPVVDEELPVVEERPPVLQESAPGEPVSAESPPQYGNAVERVFTAPSPEPAINAAEVVGTDPCEDPFTPSRDNEESKEPDAAVIKTGTGTVNHCISAGFEAKARGNLVGAVEYFFKALHLNQGRQISAALALEISAAYQELGQYLQAGMILRSVLEQKDMIDDPSLRQRLQGQRIYLDVLAGLLRTAKMPNAPYSKIPNLIKIKANLETAERLKEITKGGRVSEKQPADFRATGS